MEKGVKKKTGGNTRTALCAVYTGFQCAVYTGFQCAVYTGFKWCNNDCVKVIDNQSLNT